MRPEVEVEARPKERKSVFLFFNEAPSTLYLSFSSLLSPTSTYLPLLGPGMIIDATLNAVLQPMAISGVDTRASNVANGR